MRNSRAIGRTIAVAAVLVAAVAVAVVILGGGGDNYEIKARFQNAAQLVKGNLVQVAGHPIGEITEIELTDDGQAEITLSINEDDAPLRRGTEAIVRASSLSGVANRYIDLRLGPGDAGDIPEGGRIETSSTTTAVDLDQLFNTLDEDTRNALRDVIRGSATQYAGVGERANAGLLYLNPSLISTARLARELTSGKQDLKRFLDETAGLVGDLDDRRDDLAGLISNLSQTTGAIANERDALAEAIQRLPGFMRRSNSTFVNLRAALDDLAPLVEESKPVAKKLRPLLAELRPLAQNARPTLRDLSRLIQRAGANNDLIELANSSVPVSVLATKDRTRNGESRPGAFPASVAALRRAAPKLAHARPYAPDLMGWFDDFSHSGVYDALGGASRAQIGVNLFATVNGLPSLPLLTNDARQNAVNNVAQIGQYNRCPGSLERNLDGSNAGKPTPDHSCDPNHRIMGN